MPEHLKKPEIQEGASDARRRRRAELVLADPGITLDAITQEVFNGLLENEIREERRNGLVSIELLPVLGKRIINRIVAALADSNAKKIFNENAIRESLQELLDVFLRDYQ